MEDAGEVEQSSEEKEQEVQLTPRCQPACCHDGEHLSNQRKEERFTFLTALEGLVQDGLFLLLLDLWQRTTL
jgi:hypothetical protein